MVYAGLVILFSSVPNLTSPKIRFLALDKVAHFVEYAVFALLAFRSFSKSSWVPPRLTYPLCLLFLLVFAAFDEYYQKFIPGRHSDLFDLLTDLGGASLVLILLAISRRKTAKGIK